jgi:hypothetical protein
MRENEKGETSPIGSGFRTRTHLFTLYPTNGAFSKNAIHCPESRKQSVRKAWAIISGRTNWIVSFVQVSLRLKSSEGQLQEDWWERYHMQERWEGIPRKQGSSQKREKEQERT